MRKSEREVKDAAEKFAALLRCGYMTLAIPRGEEAPYLVPLNFGAELAGERLTLYVTAMAWLDEDDCQVTVDLTRGTAQNLPEGVTLEEVRRVEGSGHIELCFRVPNFGGSYPQLFDWTYTDPEGGTHRSNSSGMNTDDTEDVDYEMFYLEDYPYDTVTLTLERTQWGALKEPIAVEIK